MYDVFVNISGRDVILPDSKYYSVRGRYIDLLLKGYGNAYFTRDMVASDNDSQVFFESAIKLTKGKFPTEPDEPNVFSYIVGLIYFVFGYSTIWIRCFNITISIVSVYLLFLVARRQFGVLASNLFLLASLLLPTQFVYSITLSRDFIRVFVVALSIFIVYGGVKWIRR